MPEGKGAKASVLRFNATASCVSTSMSKFCAQQMHLLQTCVQRATSTSDLRSIAFGPPLTTMVEQVWLYRTLCSSSCQALSPRLRLSSAWPSRLPAPPPCRASEREIVRLIGCDASPHTGARVIPH